MPPTWTSVRGATRCYRQTRLTRSCFGPDNAIDYWPQVASKGYCLVLSHVEQVFLAPHEASPGAVSPPIDLLSAIARRSATMSVTHYICRRGGSTASSSCDRNIASATWSAGLPSARGTSSRCRFGSVLTRQPASPSTDVLPRPRPCC